MLIGADKYNESVDGEILKCSVSGITATSNKQGWLLSGPVACTTVIENNFTDSVSHLVIDRKEAFTPPNLTEGPKTGKNGEAKELVDALSQFWKNEACGIHDIGNVEDIKDSQYGNLDISSNDTRYEASLP